MTDLLYLKPETTKITVDILTNHGDLDVIEPDLITFYFTCDGGKFGTNEALDEIAITPRELLKILQSQEETTHD